MEPMPSAIGVLTAMITPAVLISACGMLTLATSNRLGRVVDRVRAIAREFEELSHGTPGAGLQAQRRALIFSQLGQLTRRAKLLQLALTSLYVALGVFIATSVALGMVQLTAMTATWVPVLMALIGGACLLVSSVVLILESRIALQMVVTEMDFLWEAGQELAPAELVPPRRSRRARLAARVRGH